MLLLVACPVKRIISTEWQVFVRKFTQTHAILIVGLLDRVEAHAVPYHQLEKKHLAYIVNYCAIGNGTDRSVQWPRLQLQI